MACAKSGKPERMQPVRELPGTQCGQKQGSIKATGSTGLVHYAQHWKLGSFSARECRRYVGQEKQSPLSGGFPLVCRGNRDRGEKESCRLVTKIPYIWVEET